MQMAMLCLVKVVKAEVAREEEVEKEEEEGVRKIWNLKMLLNISKDSMVMIPFQGMLDFSILKETKETVIFLNSKEKC